MPSPEAIIGTAAPLDYEAPRKNPLCSMRRAAGAVVLLIAALAWPISQMGVASGVMIVAWTWRSTDVSLPLYFYSNCTGASVAVLSGRMIWPTRRDRDLVAHSKLTPEPSRLRVAYVRYESFGRESSYATFPISNTNLLAHPPQRELGLRGLRLRTHMHRAIYQDPWVYTKARTASDGIELTLPTWFIALVSFACAVLLCRKLLLILTAIRRRAGTAAATRPTTRISAEIPEKGG